MTSVGEVILTLTTAPGDVMVSVVTGHNVSPSQCHPLKHMVTTHGDKHMMTTSCRGLSGSALVLRDMREEEDYFGVCDVKVFRYQEILACGVPDTPVHGSAQVTGYTAHYSCQDGHTHHGPRSAQCTQQGWDGDQVPLCQQPTCPPPPPTSHGYIHISPYTGVYGLGTVAVYRCSHGFIVWGEAKRVCTRSGWSGSLPQCRKLKCPQPPELTNSIMTIVDGVTAVYSCPHNDSVTAESKCDLSGAWSPVMLDCLLLEKSYFQFGEDPRKDFLVIIIVCIFIIIILVSVALASRLIARRIQSKRGFFLRHPQQPPHYSSQHQDLHHPDPYHQKPLPVPEKLFSPTKPKSKMTPKKVSLILKIENDQTVSKEIVKANDSPRPVRGGFHSPLAALKYSEQGRRNSSSSSSPAPRHGSVEFCVLSHSYSNLPLPESRVTLDTCLPRDAVTQFATLSRRSRREKTVDSNIRHSRSFSTFHPVPVPTINVTDFK